MKTNVILTMLLAMVLGSCTISVSGEAKEGIVPSKNYITQKVRWTTLMVFRLLHPLM